MKRSSIRDCWNKLPKVSSSANGIVSIAQRDSLGTIKSLNTDGLFAVVGANGAGKSSFFEFLTNHDYKRLSFFSHELKLYDGTLINVPGDTLDATILDPYAELKKSNSILFKFKSTFGQSEINDVSDKEKGLINYVLGTSYNLMQIEEVEVDGGEVCPRFILADGGSVFDNESLSLGEQLVLYLYWALGRKFTTPGVYLLEEPEAGLSPAGQQRLVDMLAYFSSVKGKQIFIATHSPFIVSALGVDRVIVMKKFRHAEWLPASSTNYLDELGMEIGKKGVFFLEDNKAKVFLHKLLDIYGSSLRRTFDAIYLDGESNVFEVVNRIGSRDYGVKIIGVLDADQKGFERYRSSPGKFFFLPGAHSPEKELIIAVKNDQVSYARALSVPPVRLQDSIRKCKGFEAHDFFEELSRQLFGEVKPNVYDAAFGVWYANFSNKDEIHDLMVSIDHNLTNEDIRVAEMLYCKKE